MLATRSGKMTRLKSSESFAELVRLFSGSHCDDFNLHQGPGNCQSRDLHRSAGGLVGLLFGSKEARVGCHQSREIHFAAFCGIAHKIDVHHYHIAKGESFRLERGLYFRERAHGLGLGVAIDGVGSLGRIGGIHPGRQLPAEIKGIAHPYSGGDRTVLRLDVLDVSLGLSLHNRKEAQGHGKAQTHRYSSHEDIPIHLQARCESSYECPTRLAIMVTTRWAARAAPSCQPIRWLQW